MFTQKKFWLGVLIGVLVFIGTAASFFAYGIYHYNWDGPVVQAITKVLPYSAMKVNRYNYSYHDYVADMAALKSFVADNPDVTISEDEMKLSSLQTALDSLLLEEVAARYDIQITDEEYDDTLNMFLGVEEATEEDIANFEEWLEETYGWDLDTYKEKVARLLILSDKVSAKLVLDTNIDTNRYAKETLEDVLAQLNDGADFATLAQTYSEDGSAADGGNLGWFTANDMVTEFVEKVESMEVGAYSDVFTTQYGYHIVKLNDKRVNEETGETEYDASHIIILGTSLDDYLYQARSEATIELNIKGIEIADLLN